MTHKPTKRSRQTAGGPRINPLGLPYGTGSIQVRANYYWMIYRDPAGRIIQESTGTMDAAEAKRMVIERAIITEEAKLASLRKALNEAKEAARAKEAEAGGQAGRGRGPQRGSGTVQGHSKGIGANSSQKKGGKK